MTEAAGIDFEEIGEALDRFEGCFLEPFGAVEEVLGAIVGRVTDKGFGVDDEPWLALGTEDVAGVEISGQKDMGSCGAVEFFEHFEAFTDKRFVGPLRFRGEGFGCPVAEHFFQRAEGVRG